MSSIGTGYDLSAGTFSPDGRIFQVEYALKAVDAAGLAIGLRGKDGIVFAVEKPIQTKLYENATNSRIMNVDSHVGFVGTGVYPDMKALAQFAGEEAQDYFTNYRLKAPVKHLADRCAMYMHAYTLYSAIRPFGVCVMLGSWDKVSGPKLYMVDPAGQNYGYCGIAIGRNKQAARTEIEKLKTSEIPIKNLIKEVARILLATRDETKDKQFELELSWVGESTDGVHKKLADEEKKRIEDEARKILEEPESDEEMAA